jgi:hypothetical protein
MARGHIIACSSHIYGVWETAVGMFDAQHIMYMNYGSIKIKYNCKI